MKGLRIAILAMGLSLPAVAANAGEAVNLMLNWTPTADHSPFYYAKSQGWYEKAGIDLTIEVGGRQHSQNESDSCPPVNRKFIPPPVLPLLLK